MNVLEDEKTPLHPQEGKLLSLVQPQLITEQQHTITFMAQGVLPLNLHIIQWSVVSC
ncbi:MAG: hypothetical protein U7123_00685 [Potamolinea sp.]